MAELRLDETQVDAKMPSTDEIKILEIKLEAFAKLANSAQARFDSRRDIEWKMTIALWTLFAAAAGAGIGARSWNPGVFDIVGIGSISMLVVGVYWGWWIPYLIETFKRDQQTSYYWESAIQETLAGSLPDFLDPSADPNLNWVRYPNRPDINTKSGDQRRIVRSMRSQFWITVGFVLLLNFVTIGKVISGALASLPHECCANPNERYCSCAIHK